VILYKKEYKKLIKYYFAVKKYNLRSMSLKGGNTFQGQAFLHFKVNSFSRKVRMTNFSGFDSM